jgi:aryl-alcohol dehydrogenase-like predicted oxidoreductase
MLDRAAEWELLPVCINEGLGVIPWSPLRGGWLSGKYRRGMDGPPEGTRVEEAARKGWGEAWDTYNTERTWTMIDALFEVADAVGKTPAQVALNWVMHRPGITAPIIGVRTLKHLEDNLGAAGWTLSADHMAKLTQVGDQQGPYPYDTLGPTDRDR